MSTNKSQASVPHEPVFDRESFEELACKVLSELRTEVQKNTASYTIEELQSMSIWERKLPSFGNDTLSVLLEAFPPLRELFDPTQTARSLCTLDNLAALTGDQGVSEVAGGFAEHFETRATQQWSVLIPIENVDFRVELPAIEGKTVCLRQLEDSEREQLRSFCIPSKILDTFYFAVEVESGDFQRAVERAREKVEQFIAPYYLHRMRSPDRWWRARTMRQIVSPLAFYQGPESVFGTKRELRQLPTEAFEFFSPDPDIDPQWQTAVETLIQTWRKPRDDLSELEKSLRVCARWMFTAETEEDLENAFLKHRIAWEGLLPDCSRIRREWYLLLLCIGARDPLCIETVSQASRLTDRRNSLAHPEIARELYGGVEQALYMLKQSLRWAFDNSIGIWQRCRTSSDEPFAWSQVLDRTFASLCSEHFSPDNDDAVLLLLSDLILLEEDPDCGNTLVLNRPGKSLRVEALIVKACECWGDGKDPKASVCHLARALRIADDECLSVNRYHVLLTLKERLETMDRVVFKEGWSRARIGIPVPTMDELESMLGKMEKEDGARREHVGWKLR